MGLVSGAVAVVGLIVLHGDAHFLYTRLLHGSALAAVIVSAARRPGDARARARASSFELARYSAALAVAAVLGGWALAQRPLLLKGLTVQQARRAARHARARRDRRARRRDDPLPVACAFVSPRARRAPRPRRARRRTERPARDAAAHACSPPRAPACSGASPVPGCWPALAFSLVAEAGWAHAIGVVALFVFLVCGFLAVAPARLAEADRSPGAPGRVAGRRRGPGGARRAWARRSRAGTGRAAESACRSAPASSSAGKACSASPACVSPYARRRGSHRRRRCSGWAASCAVSPLTAVAACQVPPKLSIPSSLGLVLRALSLRRSGTGGCPRRVT